MNSESTETHFTGPASGPVHTGSGDIKVTQISYQSGIPQFALPVGTPKALLSAIPSTPGFVGRETELAQIGEWARQCRLVTILGPVGIGKSSLLAQLAQQLKAKDTNPFWHTFTSFTSLDELLSKLAAFVDVHYSQPLYLALLQSPYPLIYKLDLLVDGLNGLNSILCFDDYHQIGENSEIANLMNHLIERLDRGSILVTSRHRPSFDSVVQRLSGETIEVRLEGLSTEEVSQFFKNLGYEVSEELCEFIASEFGGLPMALQLVEKLLDAGYDQKMLGDYLKARVGQPILEYLFEELWRYLDPTSKEILKLGALLVLPFPTPRMRRLYGRRQVREYLAKLEEQSLLHEIAMDWYMEHEVVRPVALSFCDDVAAQHAAIAAELLEPEPESLDDVIEAAIQFMQIEKYNQAAHLICEELVLAQVPSHYEAVIDALLESLSEEKYRQGKLGQDEWLWLFNTRGHFLSRRRLWDQAEKEYQAMLHLAEERDDKSAVSVALQNLGVTHQLAKDYDPPDKAKVRERQAEQFYRNSLVVKKGIEDLLGQAQLHGNLGNLYLDREEFTLAKREFDLQLELLRKAGVDDWYYLSAYTSRGRLFSEQSQHRDAIESYRKAMSITEEHESLADIAKLAHNLGHSYQEIEDNDKAIELYERAYQLSCEGNFLEIQDRSVIALGKIYDTLGQYDDSIKYFEEAGEIRRELRDFAGLASVYFDISTFHYLNNDAEQARDYVLKGLTLFDHLTSESQIDLFANNAYQMLREAGMLEMARQQFKTLRKRILSREGVSPYALLKVYEVLAQIYLELSKTRVANWCFTQLIGLVTQSRSGQELVEYLGWVGALFEQADKFAYSLHWYGQAVEAAAREGLGVSQAGMLYNIGNVYMALERWDDAEANYRTSLQIAEQAGKVRLQDRILHNMGHIRWQQEDFDGAIAMLTQSLELSKQQNDVDGQATALNNLGLVYADSGQAGEAVACFEECLSIRRGSGARSGEAHVLISLGNFYTNLKEFDEADPCCRESLRIARETEDWEMEEKAVLSLGFLYRRKGEFAQIEDLFQQTGQKTSDMGRYAQFTDFLTLAGDAAVDIGELKDAAESYAQGLLVSFYVWGERTIDNLELESSLYSREFRDVWSSILVTVKDFVKKGRQVAAREFCQYLLKAIKEDEELYEYTANSIWPYLEAISSYLEAPTSQSFESFLESLRSSE